MVIKNPSHFPGENRPFLIAGPCSAETEEQVMQTARELDRLGTVQLYRAGLWKPRTRPGSFEGVGEIGLPWLARVKQETSLGIITEVAQAQHVEKCLNIGIDALWIGARTTANPFAMKELAAALEGVDLPVYVKNPINPDLALWIGGVERIAKAGVSKIAVIHRGFSSAGEKIYRNKPLWQIAIDFMTEMPEMPILCDPSHICGRRDLLASIAQKAMNLNYHGLMMETHIDPDKAWSDAFQQITPAVFGEMMAHLEVRKEAGSKQVMNELDRLRKEIDLIDDEIIHNLISRMALANKIGRYKSMNQITILQAARWKEILNKYLEKGRENNLSEEFVNRFIKAIHDESINHQENHQKPFDP